MQAFLKACALWVGLLLQNNKGNFKDQSANEMKAFLFPRSVVNTDAYKMIWMPRQPINHF